MLQSFELRLLSPQGEYLFSLRDVSSIEYGRKKNDEGIAIVELDGSSYDFDIFQRDCILEIYKVNEYTGKSELQGNTCWFLRKVELDVEDKTSEKITLTFYDTITLLTRRIVAWAGVADPNYPSIILDFLDNIISLIAWYNFGEAVVSPTYANSSITGYTPSGSFAATPAIESWQFDEYGASSGDIINRKFPITIPMPPTQSTLTGTHRFEFETVLKAMQDIAESAQLQGESIWFDIEYFPATVINGSQFIFRTWVKARGTDRTTRGNRIVIGPEFGNMTDVKITKDWTTEATLIYVGGNGDNELKDMASVSKNQPDAPFYPIESYISVNVGDGAGVHETEALKNEGKIELAKRSVFQIMEGEIISQPPTEFGKDFYYGDILVAKYKGYEKNVEVAEYKISVDSSGFKITIPFSTVEG